MRGAFPAAAAIAICLTGCGAGRTGGAPSGAELFAQDCQSCHSLVGAESGHKQGGDLVAYRMSRNDLISFTREMPVRRALTRRDLAAVVAYVLRAERTGGPRTTAGTGR